MSGRGWICPVCGRGNAPYMPHCNCYREQVNAPQQPTPTATDNELEYIERIRKQAGSAPPINACPFCNVVHGNMEVCRKGVWQ